MKYIVFIFAFMFLAIPAMAQTEGIVAIVNNEAISASDINDRMHMTIVSSGIKPTPEAIESIKAKDLNGLINERLMIQEAVRLDIEVTEEEIDQGFATLAAQNNLKPEEFEQTLIAAKVNPATIRNQVRAQLAWNKVILRDIRPRIIVGDSDVDFFLKQIRNNIGAQEYALAEIFLPVISVAEENKVAKLASELSQQAQKQPAVFYKMAQQFSQGAGAADGGQLGWVQTGQLAEEIDAVLVHMEKGMVSDPIRTSLGYHIFYVLDTREITEDKIPAREQVEQIIGTKRMEKMQANHLQDLRSSAFIEIRI